MRTLIILLVLTPLLNAKPFGVGAHMVNNLEQTAWMPEGDEIVTALGSARMNAGTQSDVVGLSHAEDLVFWIDMGTATPTWHLVSVDVSGPAAFCAIDADYDGDLDLVVSSRWERRLQLFINQGDGGFLAAADIATGLDTVVGLRAVDVDGDTKVDLVGISDFDGEVFWMKHNVNGSFGIKQLIVTTSGSPTHLELVDFDANGTLDVAVLDDDPGAVMVLSNNGSGGFTQIAQLGNGVTSFVTSVFDGVRPDVITQSSVLGSCLGFRNNNAGGFDSTPHTLVSDSNGQQVVGHGDLDHDGELDLLLGGYAANDILWMRSRGSFNFDAPLVAAGSTSSPTLSLLVDTDDDSDVELVQASLLGGGLAHYEGFGVNPYAAWLGSFGLTTAADPLDGDTNGDGVDNMSAYAFNLSPVVTATPRHLILETGIAGLPTGVFEDLASDLGIEFIRRRGNSTGLTYSVLLSGDLNDWVPVDLSSATTTVIDLDWERVRYLLPASSDTHRFLRLKIDYNDLITP